MGVPKTYREKYSGRGSAVESSRDLLTFAPIYGHPVFRKVFVLVIHVWVATVMIGWCFTTGLTDLLCAHSLSVCAMHLDYTCI